MGVEIGQIAIVMIFLPLAYSIRDSVFYRWRLLRIGSITAGTVALVWLGERLFDYPLFDTLITV